MHYRLTYLGESDYDEDGNIIFPNKWVYEISGVDNITASSDGCRIRTISPIKEVITLFLTSIPSRIDVEKDYTEKHVWIFDKETSNKHKEPHKLLDSNHSATIFRKEV